MALFLFAVLLAAGDHPKSFSNAQLDSLRRIPEDSPAFAESRYELASWNLETNTVNGRRLALDFINEALRKDKSDLKALILKVRILYEQGFFYSCDRASTDLLRIGPKPGLTYNTYFAEAYYYKGLVAERSALKYKNMVSFVESGMLDLSSYGRDDMLRAASFFEKTLVYNSTHRDATIHLALMYFEIKSYEKMAHFLEKLADTNPSDYEVHCMAGLACYLAGRFDQSDEYYCKALKLMPAETRTIFENIDGIVPQDALELSRDSSYRSAFWAKNDPLKLTKYNERQLEHYNRLTYSHLRFGVPKMGIPGWKTDRGVLFIRYGDPLFRYKTQPDERFLGGLETWIYPEYTFQFEDEYSTGHYVMDQSSFLQYRSAYHTKADAYTLPSTYSFELQGDIFQFKGQQGTTRIRAYTSALTHQVDPSFEETGFPVKLQNGLFLLDEKGKIVHQIRQTKELSINEVNELSFISDVEVNISPEGSFEEAVMEWLTTGDQHFGVCRRAFHPRVFPQEDFCVSDVVVGFRQDSFPLKVTYRFRPSDIVCLYFEMYNLGLGDDHTARYTIAASLHHRPTAGFLSGLRKRRHEPILTSVFEGRSAQRDETYSLGLNIRDVPPGNYRLELTVTDALSGKSETKVIDNLQIGKEQ